MLALIEEYGKERLYMDCMDVLDDPQQCLWRMKPELEPIEKQEDVHFCKRCMEYMLVNETEAYAVCIYCGVAKPIMIFRVNYKDMTFERTGYLYKRITHFRKHWNDLRQMICNIRIEHYTERAELMFKTIEPLFREYKPEERRNFFNYKYVLIKFFELFKRPDVRKHLTYLKSKEKLQKHDDIWRRICADMGWTFIPSRRRVEHKRKYKKRVRRKKR
jgi:hypothetical protein